MIRYDRDWRGYRDSESVVITCSTCGHVWQAIAFGRDDAYRVGERHQIQVHGVPADIACAARWEWERRARHAVPA